MSYKLNNKIEKIVDKYCKEIPYEGMTVDKYGIQESMSQLTEDIAIGFLTWCSSNNVKQTSKGYSYNDNMWSRRDLFNEFLRLKM